MRRDACDSSASHRVELKRESMTLARPLDNGTVTRTSYSVCWACRFVLNWNEVLHDDRGLGGCRITFEQESFVSDGKCSISYKTCIVVFISFLFDGAKRRTLLVFGEWTLGLLTATFHSAHHEIRNFLFIGFEKSF